MARKALLSKSELGQVDLHRVVPASHGLRKDMHEETITDLGRSLCQIGPISPVIVRPLKKGQFELVAGGRRIRAARKFSLDPYPAIIAKGMNDRDALLIALTENLHRENLSPLEEASGILELIKKYGMPMFELAQKLGKHESYIRRRLQLLSLSDDIQKKVARGDLGVSQAGVIAELPTPDQQKRLARIVKKEKLTTSALRERIREDVAMHPRRKRIFPQGDEQVRLQAKNISRWIQDIPVKASAFSAGERSRVVRALQEIISVAQVAIQNLQK